MLSKCLVDSRLNEEILLSLESEIFELTIWLSGRNHDIFIITKI